MDSGIDNLIYQGLIAFFLVFLVGGLGMLAWTRVSTGLQHRAKKLRRQKRREARQRLSGV